MRSRAVGGRYDNRQGVNPTVRLRCWLRLLPVEQAVRYRSRLMSATGAPRHWGSSRRTTAYHPQRRPNFLLGCGLPAPLPLRESGASSVKGGSERARRCLDALGPQAGPFPTARHQSRCRLVEQVPQHSIAAFADLTAPVDLTGLIDAWCQAEMRAERLRSAKNGCGYRPWQYAQAWSLVRRLG